MVVIILNNSPLSLRGYLSRYCIEIDAGVFVGDIDSKTKDVLWGMIVKRLKSNMSAMIIWSCYGEQGFSFKLQGVNKRTIENFGGFCLVKYLS